MRNSPSRLPPPLLTYLLRRAEALQVLLDELLQLRRVGAPSSNHCQNEFSTIMAALCGEPVKTAALAPTFLKRTQAELTM